MSEQVTNDITQGENPLEEAHRVWVTLAQGFSAEGSKNADWHGEKLSSRDLEAVCQFHGYIHGLLTDTAKSFVTLQSQLEILEDESQEALIRGLCGTLAVQSLCISEEFDRERSLSSPATQATFTKLRGLAGEIRRQLEDRRTEAIDAANSYAKLLSRRTVARLPDPLPPLSVPDDADSTDREVFDALQRERNDINAAIADIAGFGKSLEVFTALAPKLMAQSVSFSYLVAKDFLDDVEDDTLQRLHRRYSRYSALASMVPAILGLLVECLAGASGAGAITAIGLQYANQTQVEPRIQARHEASEAVQGLLRTIVVPLVTIPMAVCLLGNVMLILFRARSAFLKLAEELGLSGERT